MSREPTTEQKCIFMQDLWTRTVDENIIFLCPIVDKRHQMRIVLQKYQIT